MPHTRELPDIGSCGAPFATTQPLHCECAYSSNIQTMHGVCTFFCSFARLCIAGECPFCHRAFSKLFQKSTTAFSAWGKSSECFAAHDLESCSNDRWRPFLKIEPGLPQKSLPICSLQAPSGNCPVVKTSFVETPNSAFGALAHFTVQDNWEIAVFLHVKVLMYKGSGDHAGAFLWNNHVVNP